MNELNFEVLKGMGDFAWPFAIAMAWVIGELGYRWMRMPRVSIYALIGFALSYAQIGILPRPSESAVLLLANVAFGLMLFEFGYRINLRWLRANEWLVATGLLESIATFTAVYYIAILFGAESLIALLLASLMMATSPAEVLRVINEQRSSGQVTERVLHLAAMNCVLAVFIFNVVLGLWTYQSIGIVWESVSKSLLVLVVSAGLGVVFGMAVPGLLRRLGNLSQDATIAFAIAVILVVALAQLLKMSPIIAALTFGFMSRHRRVTLSQAQRNFGILGDLLTVLLFVFVGATLAWPRVMAGYDLALAILGVRFAAKLIGAVLFSRLCGTSWRKGALTGIALSPVSVLVILLLVQTRYLGVNLLDQLAPLTAATLAFAIIGPILTQWALKLARETTNKEED